MGGSNISKRSWHLYARMPVFLRVIIMLLGANLPIAIYRLAYLEWIALFSVLAVVLSPLLYPRLLLASVGATLVCFMVSGFSVHHYQQITWRSEDAIPPTLRLIAMQFFGLAFVYSTSIREIYEAAPENWRPRLRRPLRALQQVQFDITLLLIAIKSKRYFTSFSWRVVVSPRQRNNYVRTVSAIVYGLIHRLIHRIGTAHYARALDGVGHSRKVTTRSEAIVTTEGCSVWYGTPRREDSIKQVSLTVHTGELLLLCGRDGSGKTTLMRLCSGIIPTITGHFEGGLLLAGTRFQAAGHTTMDYAHYAAYICPDLQPEFAALSVGEELLLRSGGDHMKASEAACAMGISELWARSITTLSGGEQMRLHLACLLSGQQPLLLLDRPSDHLDSIGRAEFALAVKTLCRQTTRSVIVTDQWLSGFPVLIERVVQLTDGKLTADENCADQLLDRSFLENNGLLPPLAVTRSHAPSDRIVASMTDVAVCRDGRRVLSEFNVTIHAGDCVVLKGPNGSGKSSAMLALIGALHCTGVVHAPKDTFYVAQDPYLHFIAPTARKEMELAARLVSNLDIAARLTWAELAGTEKPASLHPRQARLLSIACVPDHAALTILDEPTCGIDYSAVGKVQEWVIARLGHGEAVAIVTHDTFFDELADFVVDFRAQVTPPNPVEVA